MKIGIDVRCLAGPSTLTGVSQYTRHLLTALIQRHHEHYRLYPGYYRSQNANIFSLIPELPKDSWTWSPIPGRLMDQSWSFGWPPVEWITGSLDVFFEPNFFPPPVKKAAVVTTIHDLSFLRHPEWFLPGIAEARIPLLKTALHQAQAIIAVSRFTANELIEHWPQYENKIWIVHEAPGREFSVPNAQEIQRLRQCLQLDGPYYLAVGTLEYRKNICQLVQAFMAIRESGQTDAALVLAGGMGFGGEEILKEAAVGIQRKWIRWLGYVEQEHLPGLYAGARAVCYLSCYEGFGLPPLEAMASGALVLASRIPVLQEVLGDHAVYADPGNTEEIISGLLNIESGGESNCSARKTWARQYSWERAADETFRVLANAA
jgi:alpha-1,3-rhamnosyl/mannosyltransferase